MSRLLVAALAALIIAPATAQEADVATLIDRTKGSADVFDYDFGPPKSPAMTLLGLDFDASPPSTSLQPFVVSLGNLASGTAQSAAIDIAPLALLGGSSGFRSYVRPGNYFYRLVRRTRIGAALLAGTDGGNRPEDAVRSGISFGISTSLLDNSDPLVARYKARGERAGFDLQSCLVAPLSAKEELLYKSTVLLPGTAPGDARTAAVQAANDANNELVRGRSKPPAEKLAAYQRAYKHLHDAPAPVLKPGQSLDAAYDALGAEIAAINRSTDASFTKKFDAGADVTALNAQLAACAKDASKIASFGADLDVGIGTFWRGEPGNFDRLRNEGGAVWIAGHFPVKHEFGDDGVTAAWLIGGSGRYAWGDTLATDDATVPSIKADTFRGWIGIERRSEAVLLAAQYGYYDVEPATPTGAFFKRSGDYFLVQGQVRLSEKTPIWLNVSYGTAGGTVDALDANRFMLGFRFSPGTPFDTTKRD